MSGLKIEFNEFKGGHVDMDDGMEMMQDQMLGADNENEIC